MPPHTALLDSSLDLDDLADMFSSESYDAIAACAAGHACRYPTLAELDGDEAYCPFG